MEGKGRKRREDKTGPDRRDKRGEEEKRREGKRTV